MTAKTVCRMNNVKHVINYAGSKKRSMAFCFLPRLGKCCYKIRNFCIFFSKGGKDMRFVSDAIDSSVNPRT